MVFVEWFWSKAKFVSRHRILCSFLAIWVLGLLCTIKLMGGSNHISVHMQRTVHRSLLPQLNRLPPPGSFKMTKALQHCNPAMGITLKHEGRIKGNYSLELVVVVTRHGIRSPLRPIQNMSSINCGVDELSKYPLLRKYLETIKSIRRSAASKDPFLAFPLRPPYPRCLPSHMTLGGAHQLLKLGHQLGQMYHGRWKLLSQNWSSDQIFVHSTQYSRTFQSALAFLYGFLPRFDFNQIQINAATDTRFCPKEVSCKCPQLDALSRTLERKQKKLLQSHPAVVHLLQHLNPIVKHHPNDTDTTSPFAMFDCLMGYVCQGSHFPCRRGTPHPSCVTIDHVRNLISFLEWLGKQSADDLAYRKSSWLKMYGFFFHLRSVIQDAIDGKKPYKLVLYSGHDLTLSPIASVLGFADGMMPPFASRIVFEVYKHQPPASQPAEHYIRLLYNGKDMTKYTPIFRSVAQSDTSFCMIIEGQVLCPLSHFIDHLQEDFLKLFNTTSYQEACHVPPDYSAFDR